MARTSYAREQHRRELKAFFWRNRRGAVRAVLLFGVSYLSVCALALIFTEGNLAAFVVGLATGAFLTGTIGAFAWVWLLSGRGTSWLQGEIGESATRDILEAQRSAGVVYGWADNIRLDRRDIDHLVVGRFGILAIESKFKAHTVSPGQLHRDIAQAESSARTAQAILRSTEVQKPAPVAAMLAIWGPAPGLDDWLGHQEPGIVVRGSDLNTALENLAFNPPDDPEQLVELLEKFTANHAP